MAFISVSSGLTSVWDVYSSTVTVLQLYGIARNLGDALWDDSVLNTLSVRNHEAMKSATLKNALRRQYKKDTLYVLDLYTLTYDSHETLGSLGEYVSSITRDIILFHNSRHSSFGSFRVASSGAAFDAIPVSPESGFTLFKSVYCS